MAANVLLVAWCVIVLLNPCWAQVVSPGKCPVYSTQTNFNPAQFISGRWFQISRYPSPFEEKTICSSIDFVPSGKGLNINFNGVNSTDRSVIIAPGKAFFDYGELSKFLIQMPIPGWNSTVTPIHFWVITTDYQNYALAWSCDQLCDGFRREQLWLLSRKNTLSDDIMDTVRSKYFTNGPYKQEFLMAVNQTNCPKLPAVKIAGTIKRGFNALLLLEQDQKS